MLMQQRMSGKSRFRREILDDHRPPRGEGEPGLRIAAGRHQRGPDQPRLPSGPRPQQKLGVSGHQLEDLDQFDIERLGDDLDRIVEKTLQAELGQRLGAEPGHRFLLVGANTQLVMHAGAVGHIAADAE